MKYCYVIGDPVSHSLSPKIHNAGYHSLGIQDNFFYSKIVVNPENIEDFIMNFNFNETIGLSCTSPIKELLVKYLDELDESVKMIEAVNTIKNINGKLKGFNTDWLGVVTPFELRGIDLKDKHVVVLGTGGAAKAACYGVNRRGGIPVVFGRNQQVGFEMARKFNGEFISFNEIDKVQNYRYIFNATTIGMQLKDMDSPNENTLNTPIPKQYLNPEMVIFDSIYKPLETELLKNAKEAGATVINGLNMLLYQALEQFRIFTGYEAPLEVMKQELNMI